MAYEAENGIAGGEILMEILKLIVCIIILLAFVAAIMWACNAWNDRIFIIYVAVAAMAIAACTWLFD